MLESGLGAYFKSYVLAHERLRIHLVLHVPCNVRSHKGADLHRHLGFLAPSICSRPGSDCQVVGVEEEVDYGVHERGVVHRKLDCLRELYILYI